MEQKPKPKMTHMDVLNSMYSVTRKLKLTADEHKDLEVTAQMLAERLAAENPPEPPEA